MFVVSVNLLRAHRRCTCVLQAAVAYDLFAAHTYVISLLPCPTFIENKFGAFVAFYCIFANLCCRAHPALTQLLPAVPRVVAVVFLLSLLATTIAGVLVAAMGTHILHFPCGLACLHDTLRAALPAHVAFAAAPAAPYLCVVTACIALVYSFFSDAVTTR